MSAIDGLKAMSRGAVENALALWKDVDLGSRKAVLNGWELALSGGVTDAEMLSGLRRAIEVGTRGVMEMAADIASVLIERDKEAFSLVCELAASPRAQGRIGALLCIAPQTPDGLTHPILDALANDRAKNVREMVVEWIRRHDLKQHLPVLESMLMRESNRALKEFAALSIGLLKDGYYVRRDRGSAHVTIKMKVGIYGGVVDPEIANRLSDREIAEKVMSTNA